jgi:hypothetical protein
MRVSHSEAAGSFCACCFAGAGRAAAARTDAFLRRKYATRRLRFTRTRCCCPMNLYGLKIAETQSALKPVVFISSDGTLWIMSCESWKS